MVVTGTAGTLTPRGNVANTEFIGPEEELENLRESHSNPTSPQSQLDVVNDYANKARQSPTSQLESDRDILKLAAKTVSRYISLCLLSVCWCPRSTWSCDLE